jgi:FAD/FMN-containing dehydrogenase
MNRRTFHKTSGALAVLPAAGCVTAGAMRVQSPYASAIAPVEAGLVVNDLHSQLNTTRVAAIVKPRTVEELQAAVTGARAAGESVCVAGGRHAMGGQQFGDAAVLVDTRALNRFLCLDAEKGVIDVEAGIQWPELIQQLAAAQEGQAKQWGIYQKQTGADRLSIGGALACNAHGRGLTLKPIIQQVESIDVLDARGEIRTCSRSQDPNLFRLVIGGYGLFGIVVRVRLRVRPRIKVRRVVAIGETANIIERFDERIRSGFLYGDYQFATDGTRDSFLRRGVFACYEPVDPDTPLTPNSTRFNPEDWARLTFYSHTHKRLAFNAYSSRYLKTSGQIYWADSQLSAAYVDNYHDALDQATGAEFKATEMITEIYVERPKLAAFMDDAREVLRDREANVIYGTVRLIEQDEETFLAWARKPYACVIFNLHVEHTPEGVASAAGAFRALIDLAIEHAGSYYLTYHRWARRDQVERCYPQMPEFLSLKRRHDPEELFQSNWYRHYRSMFA